MKTPAVLCAVLLWAAPALAQDSPSLKIPTLVYAGAATFDVGTSLRCPPPYCREGNPLIGWMEPHGQTQMLLTASALDAVGVWAWHRYVGKKHRKLATVGLYAVAAVRVGVAIGNIRDVRAVDAHKRRLTP